MGLERTVKILDDIKDTGFEYATRAGLSISMDDLIIPSEKWDLIKKARGEVSEVEQHYKSGAITSGERYNKIIDIWTHTTDSISEVLFQDFMLYPLYADTRALSHLHSMPCPNPYTEKVPTESGTSEIGACWFMSRDGHQVCVPAAPRRPVIYYMVRTGRLGPLRGAGWARAWWRGLLPAR